MPALSNPRHERFAWAIVQGLGGTTRAELAASHAYRQAGYLAKAGNSAEAAASRLLRRVKPIMDRVQEIQTELAKRKQVTVESIVEELEQARSLAERTEQPSAMVAASSTKAKILGLSIERHEHGNPGSFEQVTSTHDLADEMLRQANASLVQVSEAMREMALAELARHAETMAAIAHGDLDQAH